MNDQPHSDDLRLEGDMEKAKESAGKPAPAPGSPQRDPVPSNPDIQPAPKALTPEQQMALYEEKLKEDDWGHQPC